MATDITTIYYGLKKFSEKMTSTQARLVLTSCKIAVRTTFETRRLIHCTTMFCHL